MRAVGSEDLRHRQLLQVFDISLPRLKIALNMSAPMKTLCSSMKEVEADSKPNGKIGGSQKPCGKVADPVSKP